MKKIFLIFLSVSLLLSQGSLAFAGETRTVPEEVTEIWNAEDLAAMADEVNSDDNGCEGIYYELMADIDLGGASWSDYIGVHDENDVNAPVLKPFKGVFDGNGHTISNYTVSCRHKVNAGLFGAVGGNGIIKDLGVENAVFSINEEWVWTTAGGIVGYLTDNAKITGCYAKNISFTTGITFDKSKMSFSHTGGLAGYVNGADIENSYALNTSVLESLSDASGGIAGQMSAGSTIRNCYTDLYVAVSPKEGVTVENSYYVVTPPWPWNDGRDENLIYYGIQVSDDELKNTAEALGEAFENDPNNMINNGYPVLLWEIDEKLRPGEAEIISSSPADGSDGLSIYNCSLSVQFSKYIDFSTVNEDGITVEPAAGFTVDGAEQAGSDTIKINFDTLELGTSYTVTFSDLIKTAAGDGIAAGESVSFTTAAELPDMTLKNLVQNGDMEDTSNIFVFYPYDPNAASHITFSTDNELTGEPNSVLRLDPQWADEPVVARDSITAPGTYYMSAWVKSDTAQRILLTSYAPPGPSDGWSSTEEDLEAEEWTFLSRVITIAEGSVPQEIAIRACGALDGSDDTIGIEVDNWSIYDVSAAPADSLMINDSDIKDGDTELSPVSLFTDMVFNVPVRQGTLLDGITLTSQDGENVPITVSFDYEELTKCSIRFGELKPNTRYTLDMSGVTSIAGNTMADALITFNTVTTAGKDAKVVSVSPENGAENVRRGDLPIYVDFDEPLNPETVSGIRVVPDTGTEPRVDISNLRRCIIDVDPSKYINGETYTVTVPETVMTIDGYRTEPYEFSFTAVSDETLISDINGALGNAETVKSVFADIYNDLGKKCTVYDYMSANMTEQLDGFYASFAESQDFESVDDICRAIDDCSFKAVLNGTSDTEVIKEILCAENDFIGSGVREVFTSVLDDANRDAAASKAISNRELDVDDIKSELITDIICRAMKYVGGADAIRNVLMLTKDSFTGNDDISELLDEIESETSPSKIYNKLQGISPDSLSDIKSALQKALDDYNKPASGGGSGGGGSTGGSSGSGSGSGSGPVIFDPGSINNNDDTEQPTEEQNVVFKDIDTVPWAEESILKLYGRGILSGRGDGNFAPNDTITRAEFVKVAVLSSGGTDPDAKAYFSDVPENHWGYSYIASAYEMGIINGISDGIFGEAMPITRQDMAVILDRIMEKQGIKENNVSLGFNDYDKISDYAREAVGHLSYLGIINGKDDGAFAPSAAATRA